MTEKRKILINASTCVKGGGIQVCVAFIHYLYHNVRDFDITVVASPQVFVQCSNFVSRENFILNIIEPTPASIFCGLRSRNHIYRIIKKQKIEFIFTVFGPSYLYLKIPEFSGFADPFVMTPNPSCWNNHRILEKIRSKFNSWVKRQALRRVRWFWTETQTSALGLSKCLGISLNQIHVIPNAVNALFYPCIKKEVDDKKKRILLLAAAYPHKNHILMPRVAEILRQKYPKFEFEFICTLPKNGEIWREVFKKAKMLKVDDTIVNNGPVMIKDCPSLYAKADLVFHPSLIEVFSATYLEAMSARCALLVSDFNFSREICGKAALYFDVENPKDAAEKIYMLCTDKILRSKQIIEGISQLSKYPKSDKKNEILVDLIREILSQLN